LLSALLSRARDVFHGVYSLVDDAMADVTGSVDKRRVKGMPPTWARLTVRHTLDQHVVVPTRDALDVLRHVTLHRAIMADGCGSSADGKSVDRSALTASVSRNDHGSLNRAGKIAELLNNPPASIDVHSLTSRLSPS
jgi:hypothetical protein